MIRRKLLLIGGALVGMLLLSWIMLPGDDELALMTLRDQRFPDAAAQYEASWQAGDRSADVLVPLVRARLGLGRIDDAIGAVETYLDENPGERAAMKLLLELYRQDQRTDDEAELLAILAGESRDPILLRRLVDMRAAQNRRSPWIDALRLQVKYGLPTANDYRTLARLFAVEGDLGEAENTLRHLARDLPGEATIDDRLAVVQLNLDRGLEDRAVATADEVINEAGDPEVLATAHGMLTNAGLVDAAGTLLVRHPGIAGQSPRLAVALAHAKLLRGELEDPGAVVHQLASRDPTGSTASPLLGLAIAAEELDQALRLVKRWKAHGFPPEVLANLANLAVQRGRLGDARAILTANEDIPAAAPLVTARLELADDDPASARKWLDRAESERDLTPEERLDLAHLRNEAGQPEAGAEHLRPELVAELPFARLAQIADLAIELGKAHVLLPAVRERAQGSTAWARLETVVGDEVAVTDWLRDPTDDTALAPADLSRLTYLAGHAGKTRLATTIARRWHDEAPSLASATALASRLLESGEPEAAAGVVEPWVNDDTDARAIWQTALLEIGDVARVTPLLVDQARNAPTRHEQDQAIYSLLALGSVKAALPFLPRQAARGGPEWFYDYADAARSEKEIRALMDAAQVYLARDPIDDHVERMLFAIAGAGGPEAMLPLLAKLADDRGGLWRIRYETGLREAGNHERADTVALALLDDPATPASERRRLAHIVLARGYKGEALAAFWSLARDAAPTSPDVRQVLFLLGPRPPDAALDWLDSRARTAFPPEREEWIRHLVASGADRRVAAIVRSFDNPTSSESAAGARALAREGHREEAARIARAGLAAVRTETEARDMADASGALDDPVLAYEAWSRVLAFANDDPDASGAAGSAGSAALSLGRYGEAIRLLDRSLAADPDQPERRYLLGEALRLAGDHNGANTQFAKALDHLAKQPERGITDRRLEANLLLRLGRDERALAILAELSERHPGNISVRADYANALIDVRRYEEASRVLAN